MKTMSIPMGVAAAALLALAACDSRQDDGATVGQKLDRAIAQAQVATEQAKENAGEAKESAERGLDRAAEATREKTGELAQKAERLGERAADKASDATITAAVKAELAKDPQLSALRIDVDTHDGKVSLTGSAPSEAARERAQQIAQAADGVTAVDNRLDVAATR